MNVVLILSGGLDSTVLAYHLVDVGESVFALSFDYGQKHAKELDVARDTCRLLDIPHRRVNLAGLGDVIGSRSSLTQSGLEVPAGPYEPENMRSTVVPNRNMIMISIAAGYAISIGADAVAYGAHSGDRTLYPDCRPEFVSRVRSVLEVCDWSPVALFSPFVNYTKAEIVRRGHDLDVPFEKTWSCYRGGLRHCGVCGTCLDRREAFDSASLLVPGLADPTVYEIDPGIHL